MVVHEVVCGDPSGAASSALEAFRDHAPQLERESISTIPRVLDLVRPDLERHGWRCSAGRRASEGVVVGRTKRQIIRAEAVHETNVVLWVELGRSWTNFGFLQHAVEAALLPEIQEVVIAVRNVWDGRITFDKCRDFLLDVEESAVALSYESLTILGF